MHCNIWDFAVTEKIPGNGNLNNKFYLAEQTNSHLFSLIDGIYVLKDVRESTYIPEFIKINGEKYRKYLKIFFLSKVLSQLTINQTNSVCDVRLDKLDEIVSIDYNKKVITELINLSIVGIDDTNRKLKILDFGIGSGISQECLNASGFDKNIELTGTDISSRSLQACSAKGIDAFYWYNNDHKQDGYFDAIISSFVFDFNIELSDVKRLYRLLNDGGRLVLNIYKDDLHNYERVYGNLRLAGFDVCEERVEVPHRQFDVGHKIEKVFVAKKIA